MERFHEVYGEMMQQAAIGVVDHQAKLEDIFKGYTGGRQFNTPEGIVEMSGTAMGQLFNLVDLPVKVVNEFKNHPDLQRAMALTKLEDSKRQGENVLLRGRVAKDQRPFYDAVLVSDWIPTSNSMLLTALANELPDTAMVQKASIRDRRMMLRIVDDAWYHDLGNGDRALTAGIFRNDERGQQALTVDTGIARIACWNVTIAEHPVFEHGSKFLNPDQLRQAVRDAMGRLNDVAGVVAGQLRDMHEIGVEDVRGMLAVMAGETAAPQYVLDAAVEWWEVNGSHPTLFWAVQAMAYGADRFTQRQGANTWNRRQELERQVLSMGNSYMEDGELKVHECPSCHRPMSTYSEFIDVEDYEIK